MHGSTNECRTVHSGAVNRLAFDWNTHDLNARADRQSHHACTHDRQSHDSRTHGRQPHHARTHELISDGSALDDDRVPNAAAIS
jgi:hypothetical protein